MTEKKNVPIISESDLAKAENKILNAGQLNMILSKTPKAHIYTRPAKGGGKWEYVTGVHVKKMLNLVFGWNWDFEVKNSEVMLEAKICIVLGRLTVRVAGGTTVVKEQFGRHEILCRKDTKIPLDLGNDLKAATTDALKKCTSELGFFGDVYGPDEYKEVYVAGGQEDKDIILDMQKTVSGKLLSLKDEKIAAQYREMILEAESNSENTMEFYNDMIKRIDEENL